MRSNGDAVVIDDRAGSADDESPHGMRALCLCCASVTSDKSAAIRETFRRTEIRRKRTRKSEKRRTFNPLLVSCMHTRIEPKVHPSNSFINFSTDNPRNFGSALQHSAVFFFLFPNNFISGLESEVRKLTNEKAIKMKTNIEKWLMMLR